MDAAIAFLNGVLQKETYISQLKSFIAIGIKTNVCHLFKSLNNFKQAPCVWYNFFNNYLSSQGFIKCLFNTNVYFKKSASSDIRAKNHVG
jgi:hypothetical protein